MRAAWALVGAEVRRLSRDRVTLFFMFALPFLIILVVGLSIPDPSAAVRVGVLVRGGDPSETVDALLEELEASPGVEVRRYTDEVDLRRDAQLRAVDAAVVVPAELAVTDGRPGDDGPRVTVLASQGGAETAVVVSALRDAVGAVALEATVTGFVEDRTGLSGESARRAAGVAIDLVEPGSTEVEFVGAEGGATVSGFSYLAPQQLTLFLFVNSLVAGAVVVELRRNGVARRMKAAPSGASPAVTGLVSLYWLVAMVQAAVIVVVGATVFGVEWGRPSALVPVVAAHALVSAAFGVLFGTLARTPEQATAIGIPVGLAMAALGGSMFPLEFAPAWMRTAGHLLTPHAWTNDALLAIVIDDAGVADVLVELAVLSAVAVAVLIPAVVRLRAQLERA